MFQRPVLTGRIRPDRPFGKSSRHRAFGEIHYFPKLFFAKQCRHESKQKEEAVRQRVTFPRTASFPLVADQSTAGPTIGETPETQ
jgi:hypothetical protein